MGLKDVDLYISGLESLGPLPWTEPNYENFQTRAFDDDFMRRKIAFNKARRTLEVGFWLRCVPDRYRDLIIDGVQVVSQSFIRQPVRDVRITIATFAHAMRLWIGHNVEPVPVLDLTALNPEAGEWASPPDWSGPRTTCTCGHSWMFHGLRGPHGCNECKSCEGFKGT